MATRKFDPEATPWSRMAKKPFVTQEANVGRFQAVISSVTAGLIDPMFGSLLHGFAEA
jgi:hypothetical protein